MGCFTFRSTATVMVLSILLLFTTPILVLRKFLSTIFLAFCFYYGRFTPGGAARQFFYLVFFCASAVFRRAISFLKERMLIGFSSGEIACANSSFFRRSSSSWIRAFRSASFWSFRL